MAALNNQPEMAQALLECGVDLHNCQVRLADGLETSLLLACSGLDNEAIRLIRAHAEPVQQVTPSSTSPRQQCM